jgi:hypothetical protein
LAIETETTLTAEQFDAEWDKQASERTGGVEPPIADDTTADPTAQAAQAPAAEKPPVQATQEDDPLAALPQPMRDRLAKLDKLEAEFTRSQNDWKAAQGRIVALQRELDVAKQAPQPSGSKPTDAQIAAAAKSPEKWDAMKEDFPEWAEAIESMVESRLGTLKPTPFDPNEIDKRVHEALQREHQGREQRTRVEETVEAKHPGWKAKVNSQEFADWHVKQPPGIQKLAESPDPQDAIYLLDLYATQSKPAVPATNAPAAPVNDPRKTRLQQAATQKPGSSAPPKSEDEMSDDELWNHMAKERERRRDTLGRFR